MDELGPDTFQKQLLQEIDALLGSRFQMKYNIVLINESEPIDANRKKIQEVMDDQSINAVIGLSLGSSFLLSEMKVYPKPVIASIILDPALQGLTITKSGVSGISNFNYITAPFDIKRDLLTFKELVDFKHLAVLYHVDDEMMFHLYITYLGKVIESLGLDITMSMVAIDSTHLRESVQAMPDMVDAVYLPPIFIGEKVDNMDKLIEVLNERRLPTFALMGEQSVEKGAMASIAPDRNLAALSRRVAINLLDILTGKNAGQLPVTVSNYVENFVVNAATLRKIDYYPNWEVLSDARMINLNSGESGVTKMQLPDVIQEALKTNLQLQIAKLNTNLKQQDVGLARSALLPQLSLESSYAALDKERANGDQGSPAPSTWKATGKLSQTLFSDDAFSSYSVSKLLLESQKYQENTEILDTVVTTTEAFINLLFAKSNEDIQNNNLEVTRKNLDIAKSKEAVGSVGASEVHRWESEQAANQISLNDAYRDVKIYTLNLNRLLNRPVRNPISVEDITIGESIELLITEEKVYSYLENLQQLMYFNEFLILEADRNLPELKEIASLIQSQQRQVLNKKRAYYMPTLSLQGQIEKVLDEHGTDYETPSNLDHPWSVAAVASWPLYSGGSRQVNLAKSRLELRQTQLRAEDLKKQLHLKISTNLQTAAVSAREIDLSQQGLISAEKNFEIIQAGYAEGRNTIADLIDAQNAKINAERSESVAKYQFVLDFLLLERSIGTFYFLHTPEEKMSFLERLRIFMESKNTNPISTSN